MVITKKSTNNKCCRGCGEMGTLLHYWWECKLILPLQRTVWRFLKNLKIKLLYHPRIPLLGTWKWSESIGCLSHVQLSDLMDCGPPNSSVHGILHCHSLLQGTPQPRHSTQVSCTAGRLFTIWATREIIYPEKNMVWMDTCTSTSTAALCTTAKTWKEPKCPSTEERIQKMWWIPTVEHYAAIKNKETLPFVVSWIDLEIVKSDRGEISKGIFYMQNLKRNICCCLVTELCPTLLKPYGLGPHGL